MLTQCKKPIAYLNKDLAESSLNKSIYEKELDIGIGHTTLETILTGKTFHSMH